MGKGKRRTNEVENNRMEMRANEHMNKKKKGNARSAAKVERKRKDRRTK